MKDNLKKKVSILNIKTTTFQRIGRVIFWTFLIFLILRGVGTLFKTDEATKAEDIIKHFEDSRNSKSIVEFQSSSYAESFAYEFMTYDPDELDEYRMRLNKYIPSYLGDIGPNRDTETKTEVLSAKSYEIEWVSENQISVMVWLKIKYETSVDSENGPSISISYKTIGLKVPIALHEGCYVVEDYPAFVNIPNKADVNLDIYNGYSADREKADEIKEVLNSFFKVYYSGTPGEIAYYMENSKNIKGLENLFTFNRLGNTSVFVGSDKNKYLVLTEIFIVDPDSGQELKQKYHVEIVNDGGRYYISNIDVRTGNLQFLEN